MALLLCASLAAPALAANSGTPEITITWLSVEGQPYYYSEELGWLTLGNSYAIDLATGAQVEYDCVGSFSENLAAVMKYDADGREKWDFVDKTGAVVIPLEYDSAGMVMTNSSDPAELGLVKQGDRYGIFENPYYVDAEELSGTEPGNTGESPAPGSDSPGGQNPGDTGNTADNGGGFPVVPVVVAVVVVAVVAVAAALALKKKAPAPASPPAGQAPEVKPEQAVKFCPKCGTKVPMDSNFCPKCGNQLEHRDN